MRIKIHHCLIVLMTLSMLSCATHAFALLTPHPTTLYDKGKPTSDYPL